MYTKDPCWTVVRKRLKVWLGSGDVSPLPETYSPRALPVPRAGFARTVRYGTTGRGPGIPKSRQSPGTELLVDELPQYLHFKIYLFLLYATYPALNLPPAEQICGFL